MNSQNFQAIMNAHAMMVSKDHTAHLELMSHTVTKQLHHNSDLNDDIISLSALQFAVNFAFLP